MKLALSPTMPGMGARDVVELCVAAEEMGYDEAWIAEVAGPESFSLAGAVATATERMELGVAVVAAGTRTPALLAMGAGTVSQLASGRRFALGIGASSDVVVESWHGRRFLPALRRVREAVEATRAALAGESEYGGRTASMARFRLASPPVGPISVYVAALGPGMLRLAGEVGDGVCLNLTAPGTVSRQLAEIRAGSEGAGRVLPDDFGVMARLHVVVSDDRDEARDVIRAAFGPYFAQPVYNRFLAWSGYPDEAEAIATAFAAGDRDGVAAAMSNDMVDAVALAGDVALVRARLDQYAAAGIGVAALNILTRDPGAVLEVLRAVR